MHRTSVINAKQWLKDTFNSKFTALTEQPHQKSAKRKRVG
jgi:hypothetical protein